MTDAVYLNELGILCALGFGREQVYSNMLAGHAPGMGRMTAAISGTTFFVGQVCDALPAIPAEFPAFTSRNNQLILAALQQIQTAVLAARTKYSPERIGVVMGSSTGGVAETEFAFAARRQQRSFPPTYDYRQQEIGVCAEFIADYLQLRGPAYSVSTACSSSGKVFASARGLLDQDLCDVVIVGGADSLCELTLKGFNALEALSDTRCNPFSRNRNGINIGEGAALFVMSREARGVVMAGVGESSDAYHMTAPQPSGEGARRAMAAALADARLDAAAIDYINLHGTGTRLNDDMEHAAVNALFGSRVPASSSKALTGHTLGAAGAIEAGLCWLLLDAPDTYKLVPHIYDGDPDPALNAIRLCTTATAPDPVNITLSNSFAFGGSNVSVILRRLSHA